MNASTEIGPAVPPVAGPQVDPAGWAEALATLLSARLGLIQLESKGVIRQLVKCVACAAVAVVCVVFGYILLLAGVVALIADKAGWPWYWVALAAALLHFVAAAILGFMAKPSLGNAFAVTRAEFLKDREWLKNFQTTKRSSS